MRLLICAGGTGGGVYPALAVLQTMSKEAHTLLWVGGEGGMEAGLVQRAGLDFATIPAAGVHGVGLRSLPGNLMRLGRGFFAARRILCSFQPDVLFFTGGYVAVPMALAGRGTPSLLYVPDIEPGLALKTLARFASAIALTAEESRGYFSSRSRLKVTGYPTRPELVAGNKTQARMKLGLQEDLPVLLVFGGSKGARSINRALIQALSGLLEKAQVLHISGSLDWEEVEANRAQLAPDQARRYHAFAYLHEDMGAALAAADLVLSRAGASTLGEFPLFGLPAVLVPYPYAWRYQKVNADHLARQGAAVVLRDEELAARLQSTLLDLLADHRKLESMSAAMRSLAAPDAARSIAGLLKSLAAHSPQPTGGLAA